MKPNESQANQARASGLLAGAGVKSTPRPTAEGRKLVIKCDGCKKDIGPLDIALSQRKLEKGFFEVGLTCPHCNLWVHSYYTNNELEQARKTFQRFASNAYKSIHHANNYLKQKERLQRKHREIQEQAKAIFG